MQPNLTNSKRIAKNTILLYLRMFFLMCVSFYTSRIILKVLGVEDFGIYNVVGGVVLLFGFLNSSLSAATQRYITFELGTDNENKLSKVFNTALIIHGLLSLLIILLSETVGLWFVLNKMQIPATRMIAAFWTYQCSIIASVILVMSVPYNAVIIAYEKMSAFAYISIFEAVAKLLIVYILLLTSKDKLILYSILFVVVQLLVRLCYGWYCNKNFSATKLSLCWDKNLIKEMLAFAGWNVFGACAALVMTQGLNVLLNVFFGPVVNAARAIAVQVQSAVMQFVGNFQMAINPQIIKSYAANDYQYMQNLILRSAKFSFFLIYISSIFIVIETNMVLRIWLDVVPDHTVMFLRLIIITSWITAIANPLINAAQATGKIRLYQSTVGSLLIAILPLSYLCLKFGMPAFSVFIINLIIEAIALIVRLVIVKHLMEFSIKNFFRQVIVTNLYVIIPSVVLPLFLYLNIEECYTRLFAVFLSSVITTLLMIWLVGLDIGEKDYMKQFVVKKLQHIIK